MADVPRSFYEEFQECLADISKDLHESVMTFDPAMFAAVQRGVLATLREAAGDGTKAIADLKSMCVWMFLAGREHAARGYAAPVNRKDGIEMEIPDTIEEMFK